MNIYTNAFRFLLTRQAIRERMRKALQIRWL